jgi:hypothetical protein
MTFRTWLLAGAVLPALACYQATLAEEFAPIVLAQDGPARQKDDAPAAKPEAPILMDEFKIPPENLTSQGYGEQQLKVQTDGPERANRRVTLRRITPLLQGQAGNPPQAR